MSKADLSKQPAQVAAMFDQVSTRYDRTNAVLSVGNAALWRVATTRAVAPRAGETILDVAAGTGTSSASLARNGASVVAADFSEGMIEVGRQRQAGNPFVRFVQADAMALPFDDDAFDAVTISFGLRNIVDPKKALAEFYRVVKPGGRVVICEFSQPPLAPDPRGLLRLPEVRDARARPGRQLQSRRLRVPDGVDPGVAEPARARRLAARGRVRARRVPQPHRRHRRPAPRVQAGSTSARCRAG